MKGYYPNEGKPVTLDGMTMIEAVQRNGRKVTMSVNNLSWDYNDGPGDVFYWRIQGQPVNQPELESPDIVNHPPHYKSHPSGIECIQITEHMNFCRGNAVKYIWRAGEKGSEIEDLKKARWYLDREIAKMEKSDEH